jgi:nucleoside-diphosphate-sugar epimerase
MQNKAVVVGALGVIGRYIVERLVEEANWRVVGLSRRKAADGPRYCHIAVDLLNPDDTKRKLAELTDVTHSELILPALARQWPFQIAALNMLFRCNCGYHFAPPGRKFRGN